MITILKQIRDLLEFQIKSAKRHDLCEITITVPRAQLILREIREAINSTRKQ